MKSDLLVLFNLILNKTTLPTDWAKIVSVPVFKEGNPNDPNKYRAISLVPAITKVFSNIILNRMIKWDENKSILPEMQNAFRAGRSCR